MDSPTPLGSGGKTWCVAILWCHVHMPEEDTARPSRAPGGRERYPTKPQAQDLERTLSPRREICSAALQERREAYKRVGKTVGLKGGCPRYRAVARMRSYSLTGGARLQWEGWGGTSSLSAR